jgi:hypothetical protein
VGDRFDHPETTDVVIASATREASARQAVGDCYATDALVGPGMAYNALGIRLDVRLGTCRHRPGPAVARFLLATSRARPTAAFAPAK